MYELFSTTFSHGLQARMMRDVVYRKMAGVFSLCPRGVVAALVWGLLLLHSVVLSYIDGVAQWKSVWVSNVGILV